MGVVVPCRRWSGGRERTGRFEIPAFPVLSPVGMIIPVTGLRDPLIGIFEAVGGRGYRVGAERRRNSERTGNERRRK